jgi:hypothetical protein
MFPPVEYTRRELAQAVLDAHPDSKRGLDMFRDWQAGLLIRKLEGTRCQTHLDHEIDY